MNLRDLQASWDALGHSDPLWAILADESKKGRRWSPDEFFQTGDHEVAALMAHVRSLGVVFATRTALDFGCGVGRLTQALADHFDEAVGVDLSPAMIRLAEQYNRHPDRCRYYVNARADLARFPTGYFGFVLSFLTLQHIPWPYTKLYIPELVRVLAPGGLICLQLPSAPAGLAARLRVPVWRTMSLLRVLVARIGVGRPTGMAMYGVAPDAVRAMFHAAGGRMVEVIRADDFTPGWTGYRYIATRDAPG